MGGENQQLWTEKYRPKKFADLKGQENIVDRLQAFVKQKNVPHLLFAGPAGVGKTCCALILARELYGDDWQRNILELNASDARGIDTIRGLVKDFARTKAIGTELPKIIYLDECDSLTKEAQQALRRTMETYSNNARFVLSCNFSSRLIDPIQSRCTVFRFRPLEMEAFATILKDIAKNESLKLDKKAIEAIYSLAEGDMRKAENILQSCAAISKDITEKVIYSTISAAEPQEIKEVLGLCLKKDFLKARSMLLEVMLKHGISGLEIMKQIQKEIWNIDVPDDHKFAMIEKCGEIEFRMVEGSDEFIQLEALLASFVLTKR